MTFETSSDGMLTSFDGMFSVCSVVECGVSHKYIVYYPIFNLNTCLVGKEIVQMNYED